MQELFLCPALAEHTVFVVSVRNGSQLTGVPWDLRLAGHTSATHTFCFFLIFSSADSFDSYIHPFCFFVRYTPHGQLEAPASNILISNFVKGSKYDRITMRSESIYVHIITSITYALHRRSHHFLGSIINFPICFVFFFLRFFVSLLDREIFS